MQACASAQLLLFCLLPFCWLCLLLICLLLLLCLLRWQLLLIWHSHTFSPLSSILAPSLLLTICCCAALVQLLKGCLQLLLLLWALLDLLLVLVWPLIDSHIPTDYHLVLARQPDPVPMPMLAVTHQDTLLTDGAELAAALLCWNEYTGWCSKDAEVCYGGLVAIDGCSAAMSRCAEGMHLRCRRAAAKMPVVGKPDTTAP